MTIELNTILGYGIAVLALLFILGITFYARKSTKGLENVKEILNVVPSVLDVVQKVSKQEDNKSFTILKQIAEASAHSVEQVSSNQDYSPEEKMRLAKEYFGNIAKTTGIKLDSDTIKASEALIESAVFALKNKDK